ncbi:MAG: hypothetical protein JNG89_16245, partial [Planctomycetaceae bacterium]|nr:hypothetical protein [Planctomycetaceae bacterium]
MLTLAALCFVVQTTPTQAQEPPAAIGPSIVKVRYGDGEDQWVWGTVVLDESGDHPTSCMVVVPEAYGAPEDIAPSSEMIDERLLKRAKARYEHATVIAGEWEQPAVFVDYLPMLAAAVLEVKHPPSTLPPVTW